MKRLSLLACLLAGALCLAPVTASEQPSGPSADEVLKRLVEGNAHFAAGKPEHGHQDAARRADTAAHGQHPGAIVLSCADSRVPAEIIFDQGIGDVFSVRVAGNAAGPDEIGSIEYAVEHLHCPVIVVLGHAKCGAVAAALQHGELPPNLAGLINRVTPAAEQARHDNPALEGDALAAATVKANVLHSMAAILTQSQVVAEFVKSGKVRLVGAVYDIAEGTVTQLGAHPNQDKLLAAAAGHGTEHKPIPSTPPAAGHAAPPAVPEHSGASRLSASTQPAPGAAAVH